jgi:hypothetical protein
MDATELVEKPAWSLPFIRKAVWSHGISFPSQVPIFTHLHRTDIQWRIVLLYFVHRWPSRKIASRYGMTGKRVTQILRQWTSRAILRGYLDRIPSETDCVAHFLTEYPTAGGLALGHSSLLVGLSISPHNSATSA